MTTFTGQPNSDDFFLGSATDDIFQYAVANLNAADVFRGRQGTDTLLFTTAGALAASALAGMTGIERITLASGGNSITLLDTNYEAVSDGILITGSAAADVVDASGLSGANAVGIVSGGGIDTLLGGAGNDRFSFYGADLSADTVRGNGGSDTIAIRSAGLFSYFDLNDVQGIERFELATGRNLIQLSNINYVDVANSTITIVGNASGDEVDATALTSANKVVMFGGGGANVFRGGAGDDSVSVTVSELLDDVIHGNGGNDVLRLTSSGILSAADLRDVQGMERIILASGANDIGVGDMTLVGVANNSLQIIGSAGDDRIDATALSAPYSVILSGGGGNNYLAGGNGNDLFRGAGSELTEQDIILGNGGIDILEVTTGSIPSLVGMQGVEQIILDRSGIVIITDVNFVNIESIRIKVIGGTGDNVVDASDLGASNAVELLGGAGIDTLRGGSGDDLFRSAASHLFGDRLFGNGGHDILAIETPVTQSGNILSGVRGIEQINLADGWNRVVLHDANFNGVEGAHIVISGGTGRDIMSALPVTGARTVLFEGNGGDDVLKGGAAADRLVGGLGADELTGGGGADHFIWDAPVEGGDVLIDFQPGIDNLEFDGAAFGLTDASFDVRSQGGSGANLATTDLFIYTGVLTDGAAVQAMLDANGTGRTDEALFVIALDAQNNAIVYHTAFADGSGAVNEMASLGSNIAPVTIGLADFVIG